LILLIVTADGADFADDADWADMEGFMDDMGWSYWLE